MECGNAAADSNEVENVARLLPATTLKVPLPSGVDPSKNVTSPVGVGVTGVTVAVNITVSPSVIVVGEAATAVDVLVEDCMAPLADGGSKQTAVIRTHETSRRRNTSLGEGLPFISITLKKQLAELLVFVQHHY
jgi:hypothetical protein